MKKSIIFSLVLLSLFGNCLTTNGSSVGLIDQLGVARIVSMEVRPLFVLTERSVEWLKAANVTEDVLSNPGLLALQDQPFYGRDLFLGALEQAVGREALQQSIKERRVETLILRYARQRPSAAAPPMLDILVEMSNQNDRDIRLTSADFEFFLHDPEVPGELISIGADHSYQDQEIELPAKLVDQPAIPTLVRFSVEMGADFAAAFDPVTHLVNFSGTPSEGDYLFVNGKFDLGIKSAKGWSYGQAVRVEWMFCPDIQNELPLEECFHELPEPIVLPTPTPDASKVGEGQDPGARGDVSFTLTWSYSDGKPEGPDIDMWIIEPAGYLLSTSRDGFSLGPTPTKGRIDHDDQGATGHGDGGGPERAYWPSNQAPEGAYAYGVRYYEGIGTAYYTLKVYKGETLVETHTGTLTWPGMHSKPLGPRIKLGEITMP